MGSDEKLYFELLEWHDRRYQHVKYVRGTQIAADEAVRKLNKGYTGPRYVMRPKNVMRR